MSAVINFAGMALSAIFLAPFGFARLTGIIRRAVVSRDLVVFSGSSTPIPSWPVLWLGEVFVEGALTLPSATSVHSANDKSRRIAREASHVIGV